MDTRAGLIERAAALLRDSQDGVGGVPLERLSPGVRNGSTAPGPVTRTCTLDRMALAEAGINMPWATTQQIIEEFRIIKRNVVGQWQSARSNGFPRTVMVTSSKPREGKTFVSINLALALAAEQNLTAILVDADPVRGDAGRQLKISPKPGLSEVLSGDVNLNEALIQTDLPNLIILPSGDPGPHVPELLSGGGANLIFEELARSYSQHVIIIDTAPCLASTGPSGLAPFVSQTVFVIEAGQTQQSEIESATSLLRGCPHISFLLNKAPRSSEQFGSYSYYHTQDDTSGKVPVD